MERERRDGTVDHRDEPLSLLGIEIFSAPNPPSPGRSPTIRDSLAALSSCKCVEMTLGDDQVGFGLE